MEFFFPIGWRTFLMKKSIKVVHNRPPNSLGVSSKHKMYALCMFWSLVCQKRERLL
jgi:hypothetical protein